MAEDTPPTPADASDWRDSLPDDLKGADSLKDIPDVGTLAKNYVNTKALVGANTVKLPSRTAEPAEWDKFYNSIGRPESADKYELPTENLPEGFAASEDEQKAFMDFAHKSGMSNLQAANAYRNYAEWRMQATGQMGEKAQQIDGQNLAAVEKEYGPALDERIALSKRLIHQFDNEEGDFKKLLDAKLSDGSSLSKNPAMFRFLQKIALQMDNDTILGAGPDAQRTNAPAEALAKAKLYEANHAAVLNDRSHPEFKQRSQELQKLYEQAYPDDAA